MVNKLRKISCSPSPACRLYTARLRRRAACARMQAHPAGTPDSAGQVASVKTVHILRHGQTEMNAFLEQQDSKQQRSSSPDFEDPLLYDTKLTPKGVEEARRAAHEAAELKPPPQLLLSSPLTRALHTADITFANFSGPRLALSLARERTYFASDVGVRRSELAKLWPHWSFEGVTEEIWWLDHTDDKSNPTAVIRESEEHFKERMEQLKQLLQARTEESMVLVVHRDVVESLAGHSPGNCEFKSIQLSLQ